MSALGPGFLKTNTWGKCEKYNSPTRYRAICAQHDLALMMRNFSNMFLRARRALEFSHGLGQNRKGSDRAQVFRIAPDSRPSTAASVDLILRRRRALAEKNRPAVNRGRRVVGGARAGIL